MLEDRFGNPITCGSDRARDCYVEALDDLFAMYKAADARIDEAIAEDPEFALAHCVKARALLVAGQTKPAIAAADRAVELAQHASRREQAHAEIVALATRADNEAALPRVLAHAAEFPRDPLPLSFALGVYGLLGFGGFVDHHEQQRDLLESVADAWGEDWWFDSWLGWSYVETGQCALGVPLLERSLAARPNNATTAHGRAHGYYEMGEVDAGIAFIEEWLPGYGQDEPLHCHVAWHLALFYLQRGDADTAHRLYRAYIRPGASQALPMFTLIDSAAFAWRTRLCGAPLAEEELAELAGFASERFARPGVPFVNYHRALVSAMTGAELAASEDEETLPQTISAELSRGFAAFAGEGDSAQRFAEVMDTLPAVGGSNAQRDLVVDTYIAALVQESGREEAQAVADVRAAQRAGHLGEDWFAQLAGAA